MDPTVPATTQQAAAGVNQLLLPALISAGGVTFAAIIGFVGWYVRARVEDYRRARERLDDSRIELYVGVLEPYMRLLGAMGNKTEEQKAKKELLSIDYRLRSYKLMLMGDDEVAKGYNEFMQFAYKSEREQQKDPLAAIRNVGNFMLVLRKGLGNKNTKLDPMDMLRWSLKDIDDMVASANARES